jgi:hypothetical protein
MSKVYCNNPNFGGATYLPIYPRQIGLPEVPIFCGEDVGELKKRLTGLGSEREAHRKQGVGKRRRERVVSSIMNSRFQIHL